MKPTQRNRAQTKPGGLAALAAIGSFLVHSVSARAQAPLKPAEEAFFEQHIRPALVQYCYDCHSEETGKTRGGLLLDTREGMHLGGDNGNILAGDDYQKTLFWEAINWLDLEMPPKQKMPTEVIQHFQQWLEMGAPDPRSREQVLVESSVDLEAGRKHWAFQPLAAPTRESIDSLVEKQLNTNRLSPVAPAPANTLLRRLNTDLVGILPTPKELAAFEAAWKKDSQAAIEAKVDELLARPQYGERWGRHWLDVARYGESTGKDVNVTYPQIWRYRDYVYDAFNQDKPYDQFVREQIAGDLLPAPTDADWQENLIATGFLAMGTKSLNEANPRQHRMDVADEQIDAMSQAILGLTVSCARCHDHKNDPIPTTDYYALAGIFLSTDTLFGTVRSAQNKRATRLLELPLEDPQVAANKFSADDIAQLREQRVRLIQTRRSARGNENASQQQLAAIRRRLAEIDARLAQIESDGTPITTAVAVQDRSQTGDTRVLLRGEVEKPAQTVRRGFLQVLPGGGPAQIRAGQSGRRELAEWLTARENPLTARVMANRVWLKLFGDGIVRSPNNWGLTGEAPTHPELLDHLAQEFVNHDWSVKHLIKTIVLSKTYQRGSQGNPTAFEKDPDNKLLWRMSPRPMDAEVLRDSILALGGGLDLKRPYGSQVAEVGDARVGRGFNRSRFPSDIRYRSAYLPILRDDLPEALGLFDFADPNISKPKREATNVPAQSLFLMNSPFVLREAAAMAKHLLREFTSREAQIQAAFLMAYGRAPDSADTQAAETFFARYQPVDSPAPRRNQFQRGGRQGRRPGAGGGRPNAGQRRGRNGDAMNTGRGAARDGMQSMRGRPQGMGGGRRRGGGSTTALEIPALSAEEQTLAVFCQSLMASGEFRQIQ